MDETKYFDIINTPHHNKVMKGSANSSEPVPRAALRFTGSESLAHVIETTFVKPELRREFARRSFYLYLRTEVPVAVPTRSQSTIGILNGHDPLERYNAGVAQSHKDHDFYTHHYPLSSKIIGGVERPAPHRGVNLLFRLAVSEYEKEQLLAPPFDSVMAGAMYVTHDIEEQWLAEDVLQGEPPLSQAMGELRAQLGLGYASVRRRGYLLDNYHVTHPTAVVLRNRMPSRSKANPAE